MKNWMRLAVAVGVLCVPVLGAAQGSPAEDEEHHHGPSPEALAACKAKSEGDACEYDSERGHKTGSCHKTRSGELACFHPHHHHEGGDAGAR
jgi:hypothetical protein